MLGGADNPNGELLSYIIGADKYAVDWVLQEACQAVHWCRQISALQEQENHS